MRLLHFRIVLIDVPVILDILRNEYPFLRSFISSVYCSRIVSSAFLYPIFRPTLPPFAR